MIRLLTQLLFLMNITLTYSQDFKLSVLGDFLVGNKYLSYEFGPAVNVELLFNKIPITVNATTRFYLSELSTENLFSYSYTYTVSGIGTSLKYYPIKWTIQPYVGLGIFLNFNNISTSGNASFIDNKYALENVNDNISVEVISGLKLSANSPINFIVEVTRTFNKPGYDLVITDYDNNIIIRKEKLNFNSVFIKFGLQFSL